MSDNEGQKRWNVVAYTLGGTCTFNAWYKNERYARKKLREILSPVKVIIHAIK